MSNLETKVKITASNETAAGFDAAAENAEKAAKRIDADVAAMQQRLSAAMDKVKESFASGFQLDLGKLKDYSAQQEKFFTHMATRGKQVFEQTRTPLEQLKNKQAELNNLYKSGAIDAGTYARALKKATDEHRAAQSSGDGLGGVIGRLKGAMLGFVAAYATVGAISGFFKVADAANLAEARMVQATQSTEDAAWAQTALYEAAQRLQAPIGELQGSFSRISRAVYEMGGGAKEAVVLTEILTATARMSGASASEAAASAMQFAQALGSGVLQGDELRSILENNQVLAGELAKALGVSIGELRRMGSEGKLTSDVVANALLSNADNIRSSVSELPQTVGGAFTRIENAMTSLVDAFNSGSGAGQYIIEIFNAVADVIDAVSEALGGTDNKSTELGNNEGAKDFGRGVTMIFAGVIAAAKAVIDMFDAVGKSIGAQAAALDAFVRRDFRGAWEIAKSGAKDFGTNATNAILGVGDTYDNIINRINDKKGSINLGGTKTLTGEGGEKPDTKNNRGRSRDNRASEFAAELEVLKLQYAEEQRLQGTHYAYSKTAELQFWQEKLASVDKNSKAGIDIRRRILAVEQQIRAERDQLRQIEINGERAAAEHAIAMQQQRADQMLALGQINNEQRLEMQQQFEQQRFEIAMAALLERMELTKQEDDPVEIAKLNEQKLELEREFQRRKAEIQGKIDVEQEDPMRNIAQNMESSFAQAFQGILQRTMTFRQAMGNMFRGITQAFMAEGTKMVAQEAMMALRKTAIWTALFGTKAAMETTATGVSIANKTKETTTNVGMSAIEAAAAAFKAMAGIPYVGPIVAVGAAAAAMAAVMGLMRGISGGGGSSTSTTSTRLPSAAGGWDIPAGLNPITQLHENEMVLPSEHADTIRNMGNNGSGESIVINATGGDWIHKRDLAQLLRQMKRDFKFA
ncbi:MAG: tape measure protein [Neisseria sp.]|nr:tape measure protein [Neisseria sp.]